MCSTNIILYYSSSEYNLYFDYFTKSAPLILSSLCSWLEREIYFNLVGRWIKWPSQRISSFELVRDLLFFKSFEYPSSPLNILQVLQRFLRQNFFKTWASWKLGVENERGCPLFIVVSEDKLHFELIYLKICSKLLIGPNFALG